VDNLANDALRAFLAEACGVPLRRVRIVSGEHSRVKRVAIDGTTAGDVRVRLSLD
jgi:uncharacterized protein YggU (UPF0235/DUF167 family)